MTLLDDRPNAPGWAPAEAPADAPALEPADQAPARPPAPPESGTLMVVRAVMVLLIISIVVVVLWKAFDQIVAPSWYRTRQHHLAADYAEQRGGLKPGQAAAVLQIPGIGANLMVVEGADPSLLRGAPGHRVGTPLPANTGNSVIEGHRTRWGGPFHDLPKLVKRTRIVAMNRAGIPVEYRVTVVKVVKRAGVARYLRPSKDYRITLVTHAGGSFSDDRLVVQAIAGTPSKRAGSRAAPSIDGPASSPIGPLFACLLCAAAAGALWFRLRRDHGIASVAMVVVPLGCAAILALLLAVDGTLSPLL